MALEGIIADISSDNFDVKQYTSSILERGISSSYQLSKLTAGLSQIESSITQEVLSKYDVLLDHAGRVDELEQRLGSLSDLSKGLLTDISDVRNRLVRPYELLKDKIQSLERLQSTCDTLRDLSWYLQLLGRLEGETDLKQQAEILQEIETISSTRKLDEVNAYNDTCSSVAAWRAKTEAEAAARLENSLRKGEVEEILQALHVLHLLGLSKSTVFGALKRCGQSVRNAIHLATDADRISALVVDDKPKGGPGKASMPAPGNTPAFRSALWQEMDIAAEAVCETFGQVFHLNKAIRFVDPAVGHSFAKKISLKEDSNLLKTFWDQVLEIIRTELRKGATESTFVKQALEGDFPRFLLFTERIRSEIQALQGVPSSEGDFILAKEDGAANYFETEESLKTLVAPFQNAYLSRSLSRLFDPISFMFQGDAAPAKEEIDTLMAIILNEIKIAEKNQGFHQLVSRNVIKCLKLFCVKCEALIISDGNASQVTAIPNAAQKSNGQIFVLVAAFRDAVKKHVEKQLSSDCAEDFMSIGSTGEALMKSSIQPLLDSIVASVEAILLTMHQEDFSAPASANARPTSQCSLYMRELQGFILRVSKDYLSLYGSKDALQPLVMAAASRCFDLFLRHTSLIRPLGEGGKLKMAADFAQMELAVAPLCSKVSEVGDSYKAVRGFRPMLFLTLKDLVESTVAGEVVPYSVVMHFMFAQAPVALRSPHQTAQWSVSRYSQWLDEHPSEKDRLLLIRGALDAYAHSMKARKSPKMVPEYDLMMQMLQRGLASFE